MRTAGSLTLIFASGAVALVYEVLWIKELSLLFGSTAQAAATTFSAFFLGLAVGAWTWGRRVGRLRRPLVTYARLELGVAASASLYFLLLEAYHWAYPTLLAIAGDPQSWVFSTFRLALALGVLFPPAFFMGGTLPAIVEHQVRGPGAVGRVGRVGTMAYAVNTAGAACGAYVAGFHLPPLLGFDRSYGLAMGVSVLVAGGAWALSSLSAGHVETPDKPATPREARKRVPWRGIETLAFLSGASTLALEVLWMHMFAQVLQNSVYTYAAILVVFLVALAVGAGIARLLIATRREPRFVLPGLLLGAGVAVAVSTRVFDALTNGLSYVGTEEGWSGYISTVFGHVASVMLFPAAVTGALMPYLFRVGEPHARGGGRTVGHLAAINTAGAILGSLAAGFVMIGLLGLWTSIQCIAVAYLIGGVALLFGLRESTRRTRVAVSAFSLAIVALLPSLRPPTVRVRAGEELVEVAESNAGTVAVLRRDDELFMKVNNWYTLGSTDAALPEQLQGHLPLLLAPGSSSAFFLGLGTGITAGAAVLHPLDRIVVCELVPDAIAAAREHFAPYQSGLFEDPRVRVVAHDGRNYLYGTRERFDVIVADLFIPWRAGVGSLYSLEHFRAVRERLEPNGIFAQWLPLYQLSRSEFEIVARTLMEVFPRVTMWRAGFGGEKPSVMLVGHTSLEPIPADAIADHTRIIRGFRLGVDGEDDSNLEPLLTHYCGNLTEGKSLFESAPINRDDRPLIEYLAPRTHRASRVGSASWFVGEELRLFCESLLDVAFLGSDPYLEGLEKDVRGHALVGFAIFAKRVLNAEE